MGGVGVYFEEIALPCFFEVCLQCYRILTRGLVLIVVAMVCGA
jgi:hypothetical protein